MSFFIDVGINISTGVFIPQISLMFLLLFNPIVENIFCFLIFSPSIAWHSTSSPSHLSHSLWAENKLDLILFQLIMLRKLWEWYLFVYRFEREILLQKISAKGKWNEMNSSVNRKIEHCFYCIQNDRPEIHWNTDVAL